MKLEINQEADRQNVEIFKQYGTSKSGEYRHICVLCGNETNIDNSISNMGSKLICVRCVYEAFNGRYDAAFEWIES